MLVKRKHATDGGRQAKRARVAPPQWCSIVNSQEEDTGSSSDQWTQDELAPSDPRNGSDLSGQPSLPRLPETRPPVRLVPAERPAPVATSVVSLGMPVDTQKDKNVGRSLPTPSDVADVRNVPSGGGPASAGSRSPASASRILQFFVAPTPTSSPVEKPQGQQEVAKCTPMQAAPRSRLTRSKKAASVTGKAVSTKRTYHKHPGKAPLHSPGSDSSSRSTRSSRSSRAVPVAVPAAQPFENYITYSDEDVGGESPADGSLSSSEEDNAGHEVQEEAGREREAIASSQGSVIDLMGSQEEEKQEEVLRTPQSAARGKKSASAAKSSSRKKRTESRTPVTADKIPRRPPGTPKDNLCRLGMELVSASTFGVVELRQKRGKSKRSKATADKLKADRRTLKAVLSSVPGGKWDQGAHRWVFHLRHYRELLLALRSFGASVEAVPKAVMEAFQKAAEEKEKTVKSAIDMSQIPPTLLHTLYPFQRRGVAYALRNDGRCIIGDEMGLGKTLQAISIAACYREEWPFLIICPSSLRDGWSEEVAKWLGMCPLDINVVTTSKAASVSSTVNIISYDLAHKLADDLEKQQFQLVIADESHYLKSMQAKRTKALLPILTNARRVLLLSGTPALSRPVELFPQIQAVCPSLFPNLQAFGVRYCQGHKGQFGWDYSGASHLEELHCILRETVMIRRRKMDVMSELPAKRRHTVQIQADPDAELRRGLIELRLLEKQSTGSGHRFKDPAKEAMRNKQQLTTLLYSESAAVKLQGVLAYVKSMLENSDEKFILFAHHQVMMDGLEELLITQKVGFMRIDGSTQSTNRHALVTQFQKRDSCRVALLSITAGGTGLTLNAASLVIFCELYWTPAMLLQAEDRAHRIGQTSEVSIYYLLSRNTIDDVIWPMVSKKLDILGQAIDGENDQEMVATDVDAVEMPALDVHEEEVVREVGLAGSESEIDLMSSSSEAESEESEKGEDLVLEVSEDDDEEDSLDDFLGREEMEERRANAREERRKVKEARDQEKAAREKEQALDDEWEREMEREMERGQERAKERAKMREEARRKAAEEEKRRMRRETLAVERIVERSEKTDRRSKGMSLPVASVLSDDEPVIDLCDSDEDMAQVERSREREMQREKERKARKEEERKERERNRRKRSSAEKGSEQGFRNGLLRYYKSTPRKPRSRPSRLQVATSPRKARSRREASLPLFPAIVPDARPAEEEEDEILLFDSDAED